MSRDGMFVYVAIILSYCKYENDTLKDRETGVSRYLTIQPYILVTEL